METAKHEEILSRLDNLSQTIDRLSNNVSVLLGDEEKEIEMDNSKRSETSLIEFLDSTPDYIVRLEEKVYTIANNLNRAVYLTEEKGEIG